MTDSESLDGWSSRIVSVSQRIDQYAVSAMAATLDMERAPATGDPLPPGWQWLFFNAPARQSELGIDGHRQRYLVDSFMPPVKLPTRMWAGSRIKYLNRLGVGSKASRTSRVMSIVAKEGRSGAMCFVTVEHLTSSGGRVCIQEEQDIVYRHSRSAAAHATAQPTAQKIRASEKLVLDSRLLFRYSALTFNGHRIHYDLPYARDVEGYKGLVVQAPLTATLLQRLAVSCRSMVPMVGFDFKALRPVFADEEIMLEAFEFDPCTESIRMHMLNSEGGVAMTANAYFAF